MLIVGKTKPKMNERHYVNHYQSGAVLGVLIHEELKPSAYYFRYIGLITSIDQMATTGKVLIRLPRSTPTKTLVAGDRVFTRNDLLGFSTSLNPGVFDFKGYTEKRGILRQLTLGEADFMQRAGHQGNLRIKATHLRDRIINDLRSKGIAEKKFAVMEALLLGRRIDITEDVLKNYQNAGAMHLLAISGLHIGMLIWMLNYLFKPVTRLRYGRKIRWLLLLLSLWSFAFLSGLSPSVIRAVTMFTIFTVGLMIERRARLDHMLFMALFVSLLFYPLYLFDLGFQLSYAAVLSIIVIGPRIKSVWQPKNKWLGYFWNLLIISFSAQIGVGPLSLFYFHQFSAMFLVSSMVVIPFLGFVLGMGFLMILLNFLGFLPMFYIALYEMLIGAMNKAIAFFGSFNTLIFKEVFFNAALLVLGYITLVLCLARWRIIKRNRLVWLLISTISIFSVLLWEKENTESTSSFVVFHMHKNSLFLNRSGSKGAIYLYTEHTSSIEKIESSGADEKQQLASELLKAYRKTRFLFKYPETGQWSNFFVFAKHRIMILDHRVIDKDFGFDPDVLIIVNSPKVNLERVLRKMRPKIIVADGSNYYSFKKLWESSADKLGIRFHDTAEHGAFTLSDPS